MAANENFALLAYLGQLMESTTESVENLDNLIENTNLPTETKLSLVQARQTLAVQMNTMVYLSEQMMQYEDQLAFIASKLTLN